MPAWLVLVQYMARNATSVRNDQEHHDDELPCALRPDRQKDIQTHGNFGRQFPAGAAASEDLLRNNLCCCGAKPEKDQNTPTALFIPRHMSARPLGGLLARISYHLKKVYAGTYLEIVHSVAAAVGNHLILFFSQARRDHTRLLRQQRPPKLPEWITICFENTIPVPLELALTGLANVDLARLGVDSQSPNHICKVKRLG